ncbi:hypothetical protein Glove_529g13 [Diversispora epigaea]|uniref:Uncharacterized protein n=1 Tax=Diversispora epigaea TaxID=1348612 RepID=A0A397GH44_9GLOM|nr:hypothetical protein Glove_529g13 [Diversispora epigaea]
MYLVYKSYKSNTLHLSYDLRPKSEWKNLRNRAFLSELERLTMFSTVDSLDRASYANSIPLYIETTSLSFKRKSKSTKIESHISNWPIKVLSAQTKNGLNIAEWGVLGQMKHLLNGEIEFYLVLYISKKMIFYPSEVSISPTQGDYLGIQMGQHMYLKTGLLFVTSMKNAVRKIERAREAGKKIRAAKFIQQKWLEIFYRPEGICATQLAEHYKLLWANSTEFLPVEESWKRLTMRKRNPLIELEACGIDPCIEDFLRHEIIVYNKKKKRQRRSPTPLENLSYSIIMTNQETQIQDTVPTCNRTHKCSCFVCEEVINSRVKKELDNLSLQLFEYNEKTFSSFMRKITTQLEKRVNANNKLRSEIDQQKLKLQKAKKLLASLKSQ